MKTNNWQKKLQIIEEKYGVDFGADSDKEITEHLKENGYKSLAKLIKKESYNDSQFGASLEVWRVKKFLATQKAKSFEEGREAVITAIKLDMERVVKDGKWIIKDKKLWRLLNELSQNK